MSKSTVAVATPPSGNPRFVFRDGFGIRGTSAEEAANALERIRTERGISTGEVDALLPHAVVDAARSKAHPLHGAFTWDDSAAAHEFRLSEARKLIRNVCIQVNDQPAVPYYVHVNWRTEGEDGEEGRARGYAPLRLVVTSEPLLASAIRLFSQQIGALEKSLAQVNAAAIESGVGPEQKRAMEAARRTIDRLKAQATKFLPPDKKRPGSSPRP